MLLLKQKFPAITHSEQAKNNGFSGGATFGLSQAFKLTEHVLFLTNDTEATKLPYTFASDADFFSVRITKRNSLNIDSVMGEVDLRSGKLTHLRTFDLEQKSANKKYYVPGTAFGITKKARNGPRSCESPSAG